SSGDAATAASTSTRRRCASSSSASAASSPSVTDVHTHGATDRRTDRIAMWSDRARVTVRGIEIERKFLVATPPSGHDRHPSTAIERGYLAIADDGTEVRTRRRDGAATLTVKGRGGRSRVEEELEIGGERFERLWPLTAGRRIEKRRYEIPEDGATI